jgi:hypothetical protein
MIALLIAVALSAAEPPAAAGTPDLKPATVAAAPAADTAAEPTFGIVEGKHQPKGEKVCFNDPVLGSRIPTKRCMNRDEFYRRQAEARQYTDQIQRDARAPVSR